MKASIVKDSEVLFSDIKVSLIEESRRDIWGGFAYLPPKTEMEAGEFELRLEDGRVGEVLVLSVMGGIAMFRGSGSLARSHRL